MLDQHFDAIPMSVRIAVPQEENNQSISGPPLASSAPTASLQDHCCGGDFWSYLIDEGTVLPQNLSFIGVADCPRNLKTFSLDNPFRKCHLSYEEKGCRFFPLRKFQGQYLKSLSRFIEKGIQTPRVYVSLDLDVGAYNFTWAARYTDRPGISLQNLLDAAALARNSCQKDDADLVGFDIMEFNMHFLGIETEDGTEDNTIAAVAEFIKMISN